jgi:uncharacterized 2Fe-2S/4Fe-4S cluster protein (DUF4445 family)
VKKKDLQQPDRDPGTECRLRVEPAGLTIPCEKNALLSQCLRGHAVSVRAECGGRGFCGKCRVRIVAGSVTPPAAAELEHLGGADISRGVRLACQTGILGDTVLQCASCSTDDNCIISTAVPLTADACAILTNKNRLGLAIDLGTTTIAAYLLALASGAVLRHSASLNPQVAFGEDVMSRIQYAFRFGAEPLQRAAVEAINLLIRELCSQPELIEEITVAGNTVMHHILFGLPVARLGAYPFSPIETKSFTVPAARLGLTAGPHAVVHALPAVSGFIGSDHVAMILATGLHETDKTVLGLDIGTNTELVLAHRGRLRSTSCASGPALEGGHIRHGMRAGRGAIDQVRISGAAVMVHTIDDAPPLGVCGSGLIDAVAELARCGIIDRRGRITEAAGLCGTGGERAFMLVPAKESNIDGPLVITQQDISQVQLAKAAIRAGCECLLAEEEIGWDELDAVVLAGGFSAGMNIDNALRLGMLPPVDPARCRHAGNAAGAGTCQCIGSPAARKTAETIAARITHLELALHPRFTQTFAGALQF